MPMTTNRDRKKNFPALNAVNKIITSCGDRAVTVQAALIEGDEVTITLPADLTILLGGAESELGLVRVSGCIGNSIQYRMEGQSLMPALLLQRSILEVLGDFFPKQFERPNAFPVLDLLGVVRFMRHLTQKDFQSAAKYLEVEPFAHLYKQVPPNVPDCFKSGLKYHPLMLLGRAHKFVRGATRFPSAMASRFCWTVLQGIKRGTLTVDETYVIKNYIDLANDLMVVPPPMDDEAIASWKLYVRQLTKGLPEFRKVKLFEPSNNSCLQSTKAEGGARGFIKERMKEITGGGVLHKIVEVRPGKVIEIESPVIASFKELIEEAESEERAVMAHGVCEPQKVRVITKGPAFRMWLSIAFQKHMATYLRRFPCFALTGEPLGESHLIQMMARETALESRLKSFGVDFSGFGFVSGDYAGATNSLNITHTKIAFEGFLKKVELSKWIFHNLGKWETNQWEFRYKDILRSVLYEQEIRFPNPKKVGVSGMMQQNGQLMGSVLSFPILCVVNAICYWRALEKRFDLPEGTIDLYELPCLINGDDICFRADPLFYAIWTREINLAGFKFSVGKNYHSTDFVTVNSELWIPRLHRTVAFDRFGGSYNLDIWRFKKIPYTHVGFMTGQSKLQRGEHKLRPSISEMFNRLIRDSVTPARSAKRYWKYHKSQIKFRTVGGTYNAFLHPLRGGLGFKMTKDLDCYISPFQSRLATFVTGKIKENRLLGVKPKQTIGIRVIKKTPDGPEFHHVPKLRYINETEPMPDDCIDYEPRKVPLPLLYGDLDLTELEEGADMLRLPNRKFWREFNEWSSRPHQLIKDRKLLAWNKKLVEVVKTSSQTV